MIWPKRFIPLLLALAAKSAGAQQVDTVYLLSDSAANVARDRNGFLFNPSWHGTSPRAFDPDAQCAFRAISSELGERRLAVRSSRCLSDLERGVVTLNEAAPTLGLGLICQTNSQLGELRGHVNWFPITATGRLRWVGYSGDFGADDDLTLDLFTPARANTTINSHVDTTSSFQIEFYRKETLLRLPTAGSSWWHVVREAVNDRTRMHSLVDDRFAIVNGTFNLDGVHFLHAELHPAFIVAVLIDTVALDRRRVRERWAVMVRNLGNQGDCSTGRLPLLTTNDASPAEHIVVDLGHWGIKDTVSASLEYAYLSQHGPQIRPTFSTDSSRCTCVDFLVPRPAGDHDEFLFLGELNLDWTRTEAGSPTDRFQTLGWDPEPDKFPPIKRVSNSVQGTAGAAEARRSPPSGAIGEEALRATMAAEAAADSLVTPSDSSYLGTPLGLAAPSPTPRTTRAYPSIPLLSTKPVLGFDCPRRRFTDPLCMPGWRFNASAGADVSTGALTWSLAVFAYPHTLPWLGDFFSTLGYRLAVRADELQTKDTNPADRTRWRAYVPEFSVVWQPASFRVTDYLSISPYSFLGLGEAFSAHHGSHSEVLRGVATELRIGGLDAALEYRHDYYFFSGSPDETTSYTLTMFIRPPSLWR